MGPCVLHLTVDMAPTIFKTTISRRIAGQRMQSHGIRGGHWGGVTGSLPGEHAAMSRHSELGRGDRHIPERAQDSPPINVSSAKAEHTGLLLLIQAFLGPLQVRPNFSTGAEPTGPLPLHSVLRPFPASLLASLSLTLDFESPGGTLGSTQAPQHMPAPTSVVAPSLSSPGPCPANSRCSSSSNSRFCPAPRDR